MATKARKTRGMRLKKFRESRGWTQFDLAMRSGVSPATISRIETDLIRYPRKGSLLALEQTLELKAGTLYEQYPV